MKEYLREWRKKNKDHIRKYNKKNKKRRHQQLLDWLKKNREYVRARAAEYREKNRENIRAYHREYQRTHPRKKLESHKVNAHTKVGYAVKTGKLTRPDRCSKCGKVCKAQGHHNDYNKALMVVWLCPLCHAGMHTEE